ncbi:hypothetical protein F6S08_18960 [Pseudomonas sp. JV449]|nr:hypothetical protein [Pseudomonas sp. JV449]
MWEGASPNASQLRLFVGASLLAKNSQAPRSFRKHALSLTFFASKLAPTGGDVRLTDWHATTALSAGRSALSQRFVETYAPPTGDLHLS